MPKVEITDSRYEPLKQRHPAAIGRSFSMAVFTSSLHSCVRESSTHTHAQLLKLTFVLVGLYVLTFHVKGCVDDPVPWYLSIGRIDGTGCRVCIRPRGQTSTGTHQIILGGFSRVSEHVCTVRVARATSR